MIRLILLFILLSKLILPQNYHSPENRKLFADFLFCSKDYLRAIIEYEEYLKYFNNDTVVYKIALGYSKLENYNEAIKKFLSIPEKSSYFSDSKMEYLKSLLLSNDYQSLFDSKYDGISVNELKLINFAYLLDQTQLTEKDKFLVPYNEDEAETLGMFYDTKLNPPYKSPLAAGIFSALIPGAGKLYTGQVSEGITSFLLNGLLAFVSYNNFKNNHPVRGWIFAGIGAFFYAGNIYGSAVSANIYNAKIDYDYKAEVKHYLELKNYYIDEHNFCR